jgi:dipeptidyl aminopeptidase/acylaminoacyl peptidase
MVTLAAFPVVMGALFAQGLLYTPCNNDGRTPTDYGLKGASVTLPARAGGSFQGYFMPGTNMVTIIMPPPLNSGRSVRLPEAAMLVQHGYAVFTFEARPCAGMGPMSLGYAEVDEVADVLDYLLSRPDVDPQRIGIYGFSSAGATSIMAAARLPRLQAVIAEGGYGHFADFVDNALGRNLVQRGEFYFAPLYRRGFHLTYWWVAGDVNKLSPLTVIHQIQPRPILLIYGSQEKSLPEGYQQLQAAGDNAELWVVEGANHGTYRFVAPEAYEERIVAFFDEAFGIKRKS